MRSGFSRLLLEFEVRERNVLSGSESILSILITEASVLIDLTTKSSQKLLVEPPATVGLFILEQRAHLNAPSILFRGHPLEIEVCGRNVLRGFESIQASSEQRRRSLLI